MSLLVQRYARGNSTFFFHCLNIWWPCGSSATEIPYEMKIKPFKLWVHCNFNECRFWYFAKTEMSLHNEAMGSVKYRALQENRGADTPEVFSWKGQVMFHFKLLFWVACLETRLLICLVQMNIISDPTFKKKKKKNQKPGLQPFRLVNKTSENGQKCPSQFSKVTWSNIWFQSLRIHLFTYEMMK